MPGKRVLFAGLLAGLSLLGGCNTVQGFGEDMQALGEAISAKSGGDSTPQQAEPEPADR